MNYYLIIIFLGIFLPYSLKAQIENIDKDNAINSVSLNERLEKFQNEVVLITGNEALFRKYEWLRKNIVDNIKNNIREGEYIGHTHNIIFNEQASKTMFYFYKGELFKIRWSFYRQDSNIEEVSERIRGKLNLKLGAPKEYSEMKLSFWEGKKNYLQSFLDDMEFQLEIRDIRISELVDSIE